MGWKEVSQLIHANLAKGSAIDRGNNLCPRVDRRCKLGEFDEMGEVRLRGRHVLISLPPGLVGKGERVRHRRHQAFHGGGDPGHPASLPRPAKQTAAALAREMVASFKTTKPNFAGSNLRTDGDDAAYLEASFTRKGRKFHSCGLVLKSSKTRQAYWFQYEALASEYSARRGLALLKRVVSTVAPRHESQPPGTEQESEDPSEPTAGARTGSGGGGTLVGAWANSDSFGDVVDAGTGAYIRSAYTGEAYRFQEDGTFWYLIVGSGTVSSGAAVQEGDYVVKGKVLTLRSKTESWTPNPTKSGQRPAYKNKPVDEVN
jgi:hypothetical protein